MKISKQSIITEHLEKNSRKQVRCVFRISSLLGHVTNNDSRVANVGNRLCKILEAEGSPVPKVYAKSCSSNPSIIKIIINISFFVNF